MASLDAQHPGVNWKPAILPGFEVTVKHELSKDLLAFDDGDPLLASSCRYGDRVNLFAYGEARVVSRNSPQAGLPPRQQLLQV